MNDKMHIEDFALLPVAALLDKWPQLKIVFEQNGLEAFCSEEARKGIGRFLKLETVLRRKGISIDGFIRERVLPVVSTIDFSDVSGGEISGLREPATEEVMDFGGRPGSVLALLPCGMKRSFHAGVKEFATSQQEDFSRIDCLVAGNLNHELSYYPHLSRVATAEEIPDMLVVADFNCLFHHDFMRRFTDQGLFGMPDIYPAAQRSKVFCDCGYFDPQNRYMMLTANMLVIVADHSMLNGRSAPHSWEELLAGDWENEVILRGDGSFFCNGVLLPLYQRFGMSGLLKLAGMVRDGLHPSQMVKQLSGRDPQRAPLYVIPYFFAQTIIGNSDCEIIWPDDGAIISPVFIATKKDKLPLLAPLINYLAGERFGEILDTALFPPPVEASSKNFLPEKPMLWVGWDFLNSEDSGELKRRIEEAFVPEYKATLHNL